MTSNQIVSFVARYYKENGGLLANVYKHSRPTVDAGSEYVVVNSLDIPNKLLQELIVNVNLHVNDINSTVPNTARLEELESNAYNVLDKVHSGEIDLYIQTSKTFRENSLNEHYVNIRLLVKILKNS
ncbi:MAG: hypothetical protein CVU09_00200 [Bacteroidetes bacterium HGW-Bacteroidetes-4]|nr:MAG: hypothetical protein CVU09_00200 [Bacteroidetes bacterium HGW-Bacteroidetes-4]